jgi:subtilisin family serine protease
MAANHPPGDLPESDPTRKPFTPETLDRTVIAIPLLDEIKKHGEEQLYNIIIDVNLEFTGGREGARNAVRQWVAQLIGGEDPALSPRKRRKSAPRGKAQSPAPSTAEHINDAKSRYSQQYLFGVLSGRNIRELARFNDAQMQDNSTSDGKPGPSALYKIWLDHKVVRFCNQSISTVKADAARNAFGALGQGIVWAVVDTGVDSSHPHFTKHKNLDLAAPLQHRDFTGLGNASEENLATTAKRDVAGHGTHVAGIIAGQFTATNNQNIIATVRRRNEMGKVSTDEIHDIPAVSGMAPQCKILSLKVLDDNGEGLASNLIAALEYVQELNGNGRRLRVHGVNMSVGYDFEPNWFACGQSPLCVEVDRLVRSGVVVVVAAGNTGYGYNQPEAKGPVAAGLDLTINDPGNAELAITVGSTHRDSPHIYGVSYFSSKGPTGDGRLKPDLVAPGEKIISCRSGDMANAQTRNAAEYREDSGTSMAAPHVSGVIAAFLSIRREFIGRPEAVKDIFLNTATDLRRAVYFQGRGLVDLMRAIQSV